MKSNPTRSLQIVVYTDDSVLAVGVSHVLAAAERFHIVVAQPDASALVPLVRQVLPEIILLDLTPEVTLGMVSALRQAAPEARLVMWGRSFSEELLAQAKDLGVAGFLRRGLSQDQFVECLTSIADGGEAFARLSEKEAPQNSTTIALTPRESQLVTLLQQGLRNKEIGACLGITEGTVRIYLSKLFAKTGARDRFEVALFGLKNSICGQATWDGQNAFVTDSSDAGRARPVMRSLTLVEPARRRGYDERPRAVGE